MAGRPNALFGIDQLVSFEDLLEFIEGAGITRDRLLTALETVLEDSGFRCEYALGTRRGGIRRRNLVCFDRDGTRYVNLVCPTDRENEILVSAGDVFRALVVREE
jgi:hypothetical protein